MRVHAWNKDVLNTAWNAISKHHNAKLRRIYQTKVNEFLVMKEHPQLTSKQKEALKLAIDNGYYEVPRKITLEELSKKMGTNYSNYQVHLRKAENAVLPIIGQSIT